MTSLNVQVHLYHNALFRLIRQYQPFLHPPMSLFHGIKSARNCDFENSIIGRYVDVVP